MHVWQQRDADVRRCRLNLPARLSPGPTPEQAQQQLAELQLVMEANASSSVTDVCFLRLPLSWHTLCKMACAGRRSEMHSVLVQSASSFTLMAFICDTMEDSACNVSAGAAIATAG